ncbi:MAG TPA: ATP-binding protein [Polyangiaceae bacterium]|jgi:two-component system cell cycle sensor histidine kinase/response regulator CckA|nr:ATP-binding protein [Polyangiaceae bacterium]
MTDELLRGVFDGALDAIVIVDRAGLLVDANPAAAELFGVRREELSGKPLRSLVQSPEGLSAAWAELLAAGRKRGELSVTGPNGVTRQVEYSATANVQPGFDLAILRDVSERGTLRRTEEQLRQAQKMEAVGSLAGGIAHDFNNLLSIILSFSGLALDALAAGTPARADVEQIVIAARRAASLTRQLLTFSRQQIVEPQVLDLNLRVSALQRMLARLLGENIHLRIAAEPNLGMIYADPGHVDQVIMNLAVNARDAMAEGGTLLIETRRAILDEEYAAEHPQVPPGQYVCLAVTDTGSGMDAATQERIFEPFFTTKEQGKGTGLGLSMVFGIVKQSGGHIEVDSKPLRGSSFKVYLPRTERAPVVRTIPVPAAGNARGTETILVVEDDDALRAAVRTVLSKHGYRVLEAQNGAEALLVSDQYRAPIALLLTDVVMPRMNGRELVALLMPTRTDLKVLYMSGYAENTVVTHGTLDEGLAYLAKPVTPEVLVQKVREVLDTPRPATIKPEAAL